MTSGKDKTNHNNHNNKVIEIDITSDTICPWCFVGKRRLETAINTLPKNVAVKVTWHAYQLDSKLPTKSVIKMDHYREKFGSRFTSMIETMKELGKEVDIDFSYGGKVGNTINSHRLICWANKFGLQDKMVETLMHAYFEKEQDIADIDVLSKLAEEIGLKGAKKFLQGDELRDEVKEEINQASIAGVTGVPNFLINKKFRISGAQSPEVFQAYFTKILETK